jgi:hypothetical protein
MVLSRPAPFNGALVDLKRSRFNRMRCTVRSEHSAILAIQAMSEIGVLLFNT